jgi:hypothetical protein
LACGSRSPWAVSTPRCWCLDQTGPGWATKQRVSLTTQRRTVADGYGISSAAGELDHLVPISLGGDPTNTLNLWVQPGPVPNAKDQVENAARRAVCDGRMTLEEARTGMMRDWTALGAALDAVEEP